jgi:hypothetical protein
MPSSLPDRPKPPELLLCQCAADDDTMPRRTNDNSVVLELVGRDFHGRYGAGHCPLFWLCWGGHDGGCGFEAVAELFAGHLYPVCGLITGRGADDCYQPPTRQR